MNILVPDSWLREHLRTKATPKQVAEDLSLCSQSVEKTTKVGEDYVYEIEITTNRPDCFSVYGIARELATILPRFGITAKLKPTQNTEYRIQNTENNLPLHVQITNPSFCPRFTALIFDNITIKPSPKIVQERLEKSGIRALDNVVDISNYLMLELGQPMHTFDYDKIREAKMILREAGKEEKITTLDEQTRNLPPGTIIIEDGEGRIIDLCGIMGGENSAVDKDTKRVLLFIQTYDPVRIRRTCQQMAFRTEAASRFEKGIDPEGVMITMKKAILMFEQNCGARVASKIIDIYPEPPKPKTLTLSQAKLNQVLGIELKLQEAKKILESLGFASNLKPQTSSITATVPHWRNGDISIPEDLIEEIARIYGYHNLPTSLPTGQIPQRDQDGIFHLSQQIKQALKFWGFTETYNYSMVSEDNLKNVGIDPKSSLKIANPLSEELVYLRPTLIPSILEVVAKNQDQFEKIQVFELANIYLSTGTSRLPEEKPILCAVLTNANFYQAKGIVEGLINEIGITNFQTQSLESSNIFYTARAAKIIIDNTSLGIFGAVSPLVTQKFGFEQEVFVFDLDLHALQKHLAPIKKYTAIAQYPPIIEDLSFVVPLRTPVGELIQSISAIGRSATGGKSTSSIIKSVKLFDSYRDTRTFRIIYQHPTKTLTNKEVSKIREKIIELVEKKFRARIKT